MSYYLNSHFQAARTGDRQIHHVVCGHIHSSIATASACRKRLRWNDGWTQNLSGERTDGQFWEVSIDYGAELGWQSNGHLHETRSAAENDAAYHSLTNYERTGRFDDSTIRIGTVE